MVDDARTDKLFSNAGVFLQSHPTMKHSILSLSAGLGLLTVFAFAQARQEPKQDLTTAPGAVTRNPNPPASAPEAVTRSPSQSAASVAAGGSPAADARDGAIVQPPAFDRARPIVIDQNQDGRVSMAEFAAAAAITTADTSRAGMQSAASVFRQYDVDNDSFLSAAELERIPASVWKR